jgi:hypothetical protein
VVVVISGLQLAQVNDAFAATCKATGSCASGANPIFRDDPSLHVFLPIIVTVAPVVIGMFLGAPLVAAELETGTFRLAWTQSISRRRWFATKVGIVGLAAVAMGALLTWLVDWWQIPFDAASQNRFDPLNFGFHGAVPIGYTAFAFALGLAAGVVLRRTIPAMGATLLGFVAVRVAVMALVRPNLAAPLKQALSFSVAHPVIGVQAPASTFALLPPPVTIPNGWVYATAVVDQSGRPFPDMGLERACPAIGQLLSVGPGAGPPTAVHACIDKLAATFHVAVMYEPASRFWPFQMVETGIFLMAALALCGLAYWWLQRQYG